MKRTRYCEFAKDLYIGRRITSIAEVKRKLTHGAGQLTVYLLAQAPENRDALCIIHAGFLKQSYYVTHPLKVYGLAAGMQEALDLLVQICDEANAAGYPGLPMTYLTVREEGGKDGPA